MPALTTASLQKVPYAAARVARGSKAGDHISESIRALHWLPTKQRIDFKPCLLMQHTVNGRVHITYGTSTHFPLSVYAGKHFVPLVITILSHYHPNTCLESILVLTFLFHEHASFITFASLYSPAGHLPVVFVSVLLSFFEITE